MELGRAPEQATTVIGIGQLRSDTCHYIERAAAGEVFDIVWRRRPVAQLSAYDQSGGRYTLAAPLDVLRTRASRLMDRVSAGETITIEHRGDVVATLRALTPGEPRRPHRPKPGIRSTAVL